MARMQLEDRQALAAVLPCTMPLCGRRLGEQSCGFTHSYLAANPELHPALRPLVAHVTDVAAIAARQRAAVVVGELCHWTQAVGNAREEDHEAFHFGSPCPYEVCADVLLGKLDPRPIATAGTEQ